LYISRNKYIICTNYRSLWNSALLQELTVTHLVKKLRIFYGKPEIYYRVHKSPQMVPSLIQKNPVNYRPYFCKMRWSMILFPSCIQAKLLYKCLSSLRATCPTHTILLELITLITLSEAYKL
jgi:hypothetical protein